MIAIATLVIAYLTAGAITVKIMFDWNKAKFSDKAATFLLWPVLAFTAFCIIAACFLAGVPWDTKNK